MATKYDMTWDKDNRRWRVQFDGKRSVISCRQLRKLGYECGDTKETSYQAAKAWWNSRFERPHPHQESITKTEQRLEWARQNKPAEVEGLRTILEEVKASDEDTHEPIIDPSIAEKIRIAEQFGITIPADTPIAALNGLFGSTEKWAERLNRTGAVASDGTVSKQIKAFLGVQAAQAKAGEITAKRFDNLGYIFKVIESGIGGDRYVKTISEKDVNAFHLSLLGKVTERRNDEKNKAGYSDAYASMILGRLKAFVRWLYREGLLDHVPRNLDSVSITVHEKPKQKMTDEEMKKILAGVKESQQLKLHVLLMLNCGYRGMDIATLQENEVDWTEGRIIRKRHKTKHRKDTPVVDYKLWPETFRLLKKWRSGKATVLLTESGGRWAYSEMITKEDGSDGTKQTDNVTTNWNREVRSEDGLGINRPYSLVRKTAASKLDEHKEYSRYAEHFLGERPDSVAARHYVTPSQTQFDAAVAWLGEQFGLA